MATKVEPQPRYFKGRPVSALGLRLRVLREQIKQAAELGETKLVNREELERELDEVRPRDPDVH
jgi:hypothetical protein